MIGNSKHAFEIWKTSVWKVIGAAENTGKDWELGFNGGGG